MDWAGLQDWTSCPAAQPIGPSVPVRHFTNYDDALHPTIVQESSGGVITRTTTASFDDLGRATRSTQATTGSGVTNETVVVDYDFDDTTGFLTTASSSGSAITTGYDSWGRVVSYTDSFGNTSAAAYDGAGEIESFDDGLATYTYSRGIHGSLVGVDAGGDVGSFAYAHTAAGEIDTITYPNGMVAKRTYNEIGALTSLDYSQDATQLLTFSRTLDATGRTLARSSSASSQQFDIDGLSRLVKVEDQRSGGCTTRSYSFDAHSNRTGFAVFAPGAGGTCQTDTAIVNQTNTFDSAGRIRNSDYVYDTLGRATVTPQSDAGPKAAGNLYATYHPSDMIASMSQSVTTIGGGSESRSVLYDLDPEQRVGEVRNKTNGIEIDRMRYVYGGSQDSPVAVLVSSNGGDTWATTRNVSIPDVGLVATVEANVASLQIHNLHGDIVATAPNTPGSMAIESSIESDEFGNLPANAGPRRYGWAGGAQRSADALGGVLLMGSRIYNPATGLFASKDLVQGGNATPYTYPQNPLDQSDHDGKQMTCRNLSGHLTTWCLIQPWRDYRYETSRMSGWTFMGSYVLGFFIPGVKAWGAGAWDYFQLKVVDKTYRQAITTGDGRTTYGWYYTRDEWSYSRVKHCTGSPHPAYDVCATNRWSLNGINRRYKRWIVWRYVSIYSV